MDDQTSPALAAEALLSVSGIFQDDPLTPEQGRLARKIPADWRAAVKDFLDARKFKAFKLPKQPDHQEILDRLSTGVDADRRASLVTRLTDPDIGEAYLEALARATAYLRAQWPALQMDTPVGPRQLPPGQTERWRAASLLAVVDSPDRILDEMRMGTLTSDQAEAFRECFPELYRTLRQTIWAELTRKYSTPEKYALPWVREQVIRVLVGLSPEIPLTKADAPPAKAPPPKVPDIDFKDRLASRAQQLGDR